MGKKMFTLMFVLCFSMFVCLSAFAGTPEEEAEKDRNQGRAVLAAIGIVALVGTIYMLSKMGDDDSKSFGLVDDSNDKENQFSFDLGCIDNFNNKKFLEKKRDPAIGFKINYSW